jgi:hypothetical protein
MGLRYPDDHSGVGMVMVAMVVVVVVPPVVDPPDAMGIGHLGQEQGTAEDGCSEE